MNKLFLTIILCFISIVSFSQTTKAIVANGTYLQMGDFNPENGSFNGLQNLGYVKSAPRDFIYDAKNSKAIYQNTTNGFVYSTIANNSVNSKNFDLFNTVIAPAFIPAANEVVFFSVQKEFNGYGSNEENLSFTTFNVNEGRVTNQIKFNDISFDNVSAPFYGMVTMTDGFTLKEIKKEVAISKPVYIAEKDLYVIMIRDVTGTNRLYKIHVNALNPNFTSTRCDYNIIDMTSVAGTDIVKALYFEKSGSTNILKVGDFNITNNTMTNSSEISTFAASSVDNGSLKFNTDQSKLFVTRFEGIKTNIYSLNIENNQLNSTATYLGNIQFDYGFNESYYTQKNYSDYFGLYPNPSTGMIYFKNTSGIIPNSIKVYDNVGQLVRSIKVEEMVAQTPIDLSGMASGIYHVRVEMLGPDFISKVAVLN